MCIGDPGILKRALAQDLEMFPSKCFVEDAPYREIVHKRSSNGTCAQILPRDPSRDLVHRSCKTKCTLHRPPGRRSSQDPTQTSCAWICEYHAHVLMMQVMRGTCADFLERDLVEDASTDLEQKACRGHPRKRSYPVTLQRSSTETLSLPRLHAETPRRGRSLKILL